jgi:Domain of unknown function (DUF4395)
VRRDLFTFPNPVNHLAARIVAIGVVVLTLLAILLKSKVVLDLICAGFFARVLTGPTLSPLGQLAVRLAPRLQATPRLVPGPPKRFAQGCGAALSSLAVILAYTVGWTPAAITLVVVLAAASLEGFMGYCVGCTVFGWLIRAGVVPEAVCEACVDLTARAAPTGAEGA